MTHVYLIQRFLIVLCFKMLRNKNKTEKKYANIFLSLKNINIKIMYKLKCDFGEIVKFRIQFYFISLKLKKCQVVVKAVKV
jgi:hypothetical protein